MILRSNIIRCFLYPKIKGNNVWTNSDEYTLRNYRDFYRETPYFYSSYTVIYGFYDSAVVCKKYYRIFP